MHVLYTHGTCPAGNIFVRSRHGFIIHCKYVYIL